MRLDLEHIIILMIILFGLYFVFSKCGFNNGFRVGGVNYKIKYAGRDNINCTPLETGKVLKLNEVDKKLYMSGLLWADLNNDEIEKNILKIYGAKEDDWTGGKEIFLHILNLRGRVSKSIYDYRGTRGFMGQDEYSCNNAVISEFDPSTDQFVENQIEMDEDTCNRCIVFSKRSSAAGGKINENKCKWDKSSCKNRIKKEHSKQDAQYRMRALASINPQYPNPYPNTHTENPLFGLSEGVDSELYEEEIIEEEIKDDLLDGGNSDL